MGDSVTVQAVLFDLDGTLVDTVLDLGGACNMLRARRGLPPLPIDDYRPVAGRGSAGLLHVAFGMVAEDPAFPALCTEFLDIYATCLADHPCPFPGIPALIDTLRERGVPWGIVTNKPHRFAAPLLVSVPLAATAAVVIDGDSTANAKPHPAPLLEAARRLGIPPQACVYVGDEERDIVAARAASMQAVAVRYGYTADPAACDGWGAHGVVDTPSALQNCLLTWLTTVATQ
ncbi:phosphoglycolate phosphatase [Candidatus Symbiobacter mobilis CR]|uniref:phosphoglycolate phosphatase n=2 Tax=Candidatus Symbiobacter TaxID=1436289 RepID=U5NAZ8_9BURK|nr:phosphoglycolate phosphatase [Candidatus Symbiobacter mobilis CR]